MQEQRNASAAGIGSTVGESSPADRVPSKYRIEENFETLGFNVRHVPVQLEPYKEKNPPYMQEFYIENGIKTSPSVEHQFMPGFAARSPVRQSSGENHLESKNLSALRNGSDEEVFVSLQLGEPESKRGKHSNCSFGIQEP